MLEHASGCAERRVARRERAEPVRVSAKCASARCARARARGVRVPDAQTRGRAGARVPGARMRVRARGTRAPCRPVRRFLSPGGALVVSDGAASPGRPGLGASPFPQATTESRTSVLSHAGRAREVRGRLYVEMSSSFADATRKKRTGSRRSQTRSARREAAKPSEERDAHRPKKTKASTREKAEL